MVAEGRSDGCDCSGCDCYLDDYPNFPCVDESAQKESVSLMGVGACVGEGWRMGDSPL